MCVNFYNGRRYSFTKALCIAFVMTFFSLFDVPVFWPILLCYWFVLFVLTMQGQGVAQGFDGCLSVPETKTERMGQKGHLLEFSNPKLAQASI